MWSDATNVAIKERGREDLSGITGTLWNKGPYKPLMPKGSTMMRGVEKTLVQGGSLVFEGDRALFEHYDESSGAHASIDVLLDAALRQ